MREQFVEIAGDDAAGPLGPARVNGRRPANRHYLGVVAQEARRLRQQMRSSAAATPRPVARVAPTSREAV
jgi:hypothetical protein